MVSATYLATVNALNGALATAGVTTLTFTHQTNFVINSVTYANLIDYLGYIKESESLKINNIVTTELAKFGAWSNISSSARPVTVPSAPDNDHYIALNGYYISDSDRPQSDVQFKQFALDVEVATKDLSTTIQNKAKPIGYTIQSQNATVVIADIAPAGTKTVTSTVVVTIYKNPTP